jgi:hypothetical protein
MLASLALISAIAAYVDFARTGDVRWLIGGTVRQLALFRSLPPGSSLPLADHGTGSREAVTRWLLLFHSVRAPLTP